MNALRTRLRGLLATGALLAIVAGLPLALLAVGASPIPHSLPSMETMKSALSSQDDGTFALGFIKVLAWAAWAFLTLSIAAELISRLRGNQVPTLPGLRLPQSAARNLVSTAMLLFIAAPMSVHVGPPADAVPVHVTVELAATSTTTPPSGDHGKASNPLVLRHTAAAISWMP